MKNEFSDFTDLDEMKNHPVSTRIDEAFRSVIGEENTLSSKKEAAAASAESSVEELDLGEMEIDLVGEASVTSTQAAPSTLDEGLDLSFDDEGLDLSSGDEAPAETPQTDEQFGDLSLDDDLGLSFTDDVPAEANLSDTPDPDFDLAPDDGLSLTDLDADSGDKTTVGLKSNELSLSDDFSSTNLKLSDDLDSLSDDEGLSLSFDEEEGVSGADLSEDAKEKLKEIDAIMDFDASQIGLTRHNLQQYLEKEKVEEPLVTEDLDEPLVSDDLDLEKIDFGNEVTTIREKPELPKETPKKKPKKEVAPDLGQDLSEISVAYSGEMERMQATISNLRADREELLTKIQKLEDDKVLQGRQSLTMRAELDEKKIELTIIRKKLNEEISELKDRLKLYDEKKLILEEKNRILLQELDKANQKNKIDVKKVQLREKELEQKLELLKSDAESQIRHRDLKILELKRKIDAMEFDMESISQQEKRSVESRFELEDKLEKAIKTLRGAITVLEDESDRSNALNALKKNIDM